MRAIQDDLKNSTENELQSKVLEKEEEISQINKRIENEFLLITVHEEIMNSTISKIKEEQAKEIEKLCDQFEKEFISTQEEYEQEKEVIREEFRQKIEDLDNKAKEADLKFKEISKEYEIVSQKAEEQEEIISKITKENDKLGEDLTKAYNSNSIEVKNLEETICKLNQEVSEQNKKIHQLELKKDKAEFLKNDNEMNNKNSVLVLEKKLKEFKETSENKLNIAIVQNTEITQDFKYCQKELEKKTHEFEDILHQYEALNHQHQCLAKECDDKEEHINILQSKLKKSSGKNKNLGRKITQILRNKCDQLREEMEFFK